MDLTTDEQERFSALEPYEILETEREEVFDRFTRLAATVFQAPFAFISFVDRERQWFKSCWGLSVTDTPRDDPFCHHLMRSGRLLEVPDALLDTRFAASAWVCGEPGIRFYASAPLIVTGKFLLGALSVGDRKPREPFTDGEITVLQDMANAVVQALETRRATAELRRSAEALRQSETRFRSLAEAIPHMVWTTDPGGRLNYCNGSTLDYLGGCGELGQAFWAHAVHPQQREPAVARWDAAIRRGSQYYDEVRLRRASDGQYRWHLNRAVPIYADNQRVLHWYGTSTDIDDKKAFEEQLLQANEDLKQFAYAASHDLQEPIRAVATYAQLLERRYRPQFSDPTAIEILDHLVEGARRIRALILDLRAYTEISIPDLIKTEVVDCNDALDLAIAQLKAEVKRSLVEFSIARLPQVRGVKAHLVQLFQNLVGNSIKYRSDDPLCISVSATLEQDMWSFRFEDNGIGIPAEYQERIFGVFKRLHGRQIPGTGMGLAICQKIIERSGGEMWVESQPGHGSTFCFTLPAVSNVTKGAY